MANNIVSQVQNLLKNYNLDELIATVKKVAGGGAAIAGLTALLNSLKTTQSSNKLVGLLGNAGLSKIIESGALQKLNFAEILSVLKSNSSASGMGKLVEFVQKLQNIK